MRTAAFRVVAAIVVGSISLATAGCGDDDNDKTTGKVVQVPSKRVYASDKPASTGDVLAAASEQGNVVGAIPFALDRDGFSFENYGSHLGPDLRTKEMRELFGDVVCADAPSDTCTLTPAATQWLGMANNAMQGGHCFGFSVTALRFFSHKLDPSVYGGSTTYSLAPTPDIQGTIALGMVTQFFKPLEDSITTATPTETIKRLQAALNTKGGESYSLGIWTRDHQLGHAVTPTAVEDLGGGRFNIVIYDNNFPDVRRAIDVDTNKDTWSYEASGNPQTRSMLFDGQGTVNELEMIPLKPSLGKQPCPFCGSPDEPGLGSDTVTVALGGDPANRGHLTITTADGKKVGYVDGKQVNQVEGARVVQLRLNQFWNAEPQFVYQLPAGEDVKVTLDGRGTTGGDDASVYVTGPGFGATVANLRPEPGRKDVISLDADASQLSVQSLGAAPDEAPRVTFATQEGKKGEVLKLAPEQFKEGATLKVGVDSAAKSLAVSGTGANKLGEVDVAVRSVGKQGSRTVRSKKLRVRSGAKSKLSYAK